MAKKSNLPTEVHDHFRKTNLLHKYVQKNLGEATKHALEAGQELLAAKSAIPRGSWEGECERLFDGSLRTAQFYMQFARDLGTLKSAEANAILFLESGLDGASKAARKAAAESGGKQSPRRQAKPEPQADIVDVEVVEDDTKLAMTDNEPEDYGKCPNCLGTKWDEDEDGVSCAKCHHPWGEPTGDVDDGQLKTQRKKTIKTVEALMRAFDDLHSMKANSGHASTIQLCKRLLTIAKEWK